MGIINIAALKDQIIDDLVTHFNYSIPEALAWVEDNGEDVEDAMWDAYTSYLEATTDKETR